MIHLLRAAYRETKRMPTIDKTWMRCQRDLDQLEALFPDGDQRGAVKMAGLRFVK